MVIALLGLPGAGKSTMARSLGDLVQATTLLEPEEEEWPTFVRAPHPNGDFTRLMWFRTQRVPLYYEAAEHSARGESVILDSYYDKWCVGWLGRPGLEWLIAPDDPYFGAAQDIARTDAQLLPRADLVVVLEIAETLWIEQLAARGRRIDRDGAFIRSHATQSYFIDTALERGALDGTHVVRYQRPGRSARAEAQEVINLVATAGFSLG